MSSSSNSSLSAFEIDLGDTGEGVEVRVKASINNNIITQPQTLSPTNEPSLGIYETNLEDWDVDSNAIPKPSNPSKSAQKFEMIVPRHKFSSLFEEKPAIKPQTFNASARFNKFKEKVTEKVQKLGKVLAEEQAKQCTFKPEILNKRKNRTFSEFLSNVQKFDKKKQEKIREKLNEEDLKIEKIRACSNPKLCEKSLEILAKQEEKKTVKKIRTLQKSFDSELHTHKPQINQRSREMPRHQSVDEILFNDSKRRQSKTPSDSIPKTKIFSPSPINSKSDQVLLTKFKKSFQEQFSNLDIEKSFKLNYSKFLLLLQNLGLTSKSPQKINIHRKLCIEIWNLIGGFQENFVHFSNLQTILLCIMNFKILSLPTHHYSPSLGYLVNGVYCVRVEEILKIHQKFLPLYEEKNLSRPKSLEVSFQSRKKGKKKADTVREEELIHGKIRMLAKQEILRQKKVTEEVAECSFQPKIKRGPRTHASSSDLNDTSHTIYSVFSETKTNIQTRGEILYEYSKLYNRQIPKTSSVIVESPIKKAKSCIIKPNSKKLKKTEDFQEIKGVRELISRLRNAKKSTDTTNPCKPFSFNIQQKIDFTKLDLISSSSSDSSPITPSQMSDSSKLQIKVYLPDGKKSIFKYHNGDNKKSLIDSFILKNNIGADFESICRNKLIQILSNYP